MSEDEVKAAFIYNFTKFVEWPQKAFASESTPISLGVVGNDDFAEKLAALLKDKKAQGRAFVVRKVSFGPEITNYHVVVVAQSQAKRFSQYADALGKAPVLTIGESANFLAQGGIINFLREESQLRFEINNAAAERVNLVISSKLLRLNTRKTEGTK